MGKWYKGAEKRAAQIDRMNIAGVEVIQNLKSEPPKSAGVFTYDEWTPGKIYKQFENFTCDGIAGFARIEHMAYEHQRPFTEGMSAVYGARPPQDVDGTYDYISSMKVDIGDKVRSAKDGKVYRCYANGADPLVYDPADVPAIFERDE